MKTSRFFTAETSRLVSVGLAIFTMLFGAGNVVFPLRLGRETGSQVLLAVIGLMLTGVLVPLIGLVSSSLFNGDYKKFFNMTGKVFGSYCIFVCMLLLGPFGATPRCVTLAYAAVSWHLPFLTLFIFSIIIAALMFASAVKKNQVVDLFGRFFGPIKITLLLSIVVIGLLSSTTLPATSITLSQSFLKGLGSGYLTLDLIATIFFAGLIINSIKSQVIDGRALNNKEVTIFGLKAGLLGGGLLSLVYAGFCLLAAKHSAAVAHVSDDQLLSALATLVLGARASILANTVVAIACLTTAIVLAAIFADYLANQLFGGRVKYSYALLLTVTTTFVMTNLGFAGIMCLIEHAAMVVYPSLIVLSLANFAHILWGFSYVQPVVLVTFVMTLISKFLL